MKKITVKYCFSQVKTGTRLVKKTGKEIPVYESEWADVSWDVPENEDECQARYAISLDELIELGVRGLSTRLVTKDIAKTGESAAADKYEFQTQVQSRANEFAVKPRTSASTQSVKAKAKTEALGFAAKILADCGGDMELFQKRLAEEIAKLSAR